MSEMRALLCGALGAACVILAFVGLVAAAPSFFTPAPLRGALPLTHHAIPKIVCRNPLGNIGSGTGVRVGPTLVITAAHVANIGECMIDGRRTVRIEADPSLDYAVLRTAPVADWWRVRCGPLQFGEAAYALGYAGGGPLYRQEVFATIRHPMPRVALPGFGETMMFVGHERFIPGMSGGPIVNARGQLVGIVIGYNKVVKASYGRMLSDTSACAR